MIPSIHSYGSVFIEEELKTKNKNKKKNKQKKKNNTQTKKHSIKETFHCAFLQRYSNHVAPSSLLNLYVVLCLCCR